MNSTHCVKRGHYVTVETLDIIRDDYTFSEFVKKLYSVVEGIPIECYNELSVELLKEYHYDYSKDITAALKISRTRPSTQEEITEYKRIQKENLAQQEERDRLRYEELKKRFEK